MEIFHKGGIGVVMGGGAEYFQSKSEKSWFLIINFVSLP